MNTDIGWYPDPGNADRTRYWNGSAWTAERTWNGSAWIDTVRPVVSAASPPSARFPGAVATASRPRGKKRWWWLAGGAVVVVIAVIVAAGGKKGSGAASNSAFCEDLTNHYPAVLTAVLDAGRVELAVRNGHRPAAADVAVVRSGAGAATSLANHAPAAVKADLTGLGRGLGAIANRRASSVYGDPDLQNGKIIAWRATNCH